MASDERINQTEWNVKKVCPICEDIKNKVLNLEGEQMMGDDETRCSVLTVTHRHSYAPHGVCG